jgi:hypothetical protein
MKFFEKIGFGKKTRENIPSPIQETKKEEPEELRPLGELTDLEKAERKALTAKELYEMAETALSVDPNNSDLKKERDSAYRDMINTKEEYDGLKRLGRNKI